MLGNCGVTFAPCKPDDHELLAGMMETVEDIPRRAILEGLPWNWESYGEYLNSIEAMGPRYQHLRHVILGSVPQKIHVPNRFCLLAYEKRMPRGVVLCLLEVKLSFEAVEIRLMMNSRPGRPACSEQCGDFQCVIRSSWDKVDRHAAT